ncbi:MAG: acetyl-CoA carboxylase biotin carboxylase subunit [Alphaproteobacteria bacterium]|nr:acetyl-CoA carboxylase biotin carboxylase subunit [Alphaproteobacteria bacterium]
MFKKILIANRGEVACRLIRTFRRMGIESVAIYSEADEDSPHVNRADEAYCVGPALVRESYLNISTILRIAQESGAEAIHPGYGFLSENAAFAQAVQDQGLVFIGPSADVIATMGDKLEAKRLARLSGISCIPGTDEPLADLEQADKIAAKIGYPLMVKPAAGGGGKGMRIVRHPSDLKDSLKGAINEAESSFGDSRIFFEKYIDGARHIEIQILADLHGRVIHLGERECSLQRRHQKVIEEAPSPSLTPIMRQRIGEEAVRLAKSAGYTSAGTVEFVLDPSGNFYFLEMNTRLQVEHPVTEMITGLDIVEEMVSVAAGIPLRLLQSDVQFKGHAIEARLYAEDSSRGFLPSTGRIRSYHPPFEKEGEVRLDSGIEEGTIITPYYDPLFAKLVVHQPTRELACDRMLNALNECYIRGIETNVHFLASLVNSPFFKKANFNVTTLDEYYEKGFAPVTPLDPSVAIGAAAVMHVKRRGLTSAELSVFIEREPYLVTVTVAQSRYIVTEGDSTLLVETEWKPGDVLFKSIFQGNAITLQVNTQEIKDELLWNGYGATTWVVNRKVGNLIPLMPVKEKVDSPRVVVAPMPGLVVEVAVHIGDVVKRGQPIAIIEAMKMENIIRSQRNGVIENIYVKKGESVIVDQHLAKIG